MENTVFNPTASFTPAPQGVFDIKRTSQPAIQGQSSFSVIKTNPWS
jgi:hypothetical protein